MAFMPPVTVTTPTVQKARYGLYSVASVIPTSSKIVNGVDYESPGLCATGTVIAADELCTGPAFDDSETSGPMFIEGTPAIVTSVYECTGPMNLAEFQRKAVASVDANGERLLSAALFSGILDPADATTVSPLGPDSSALALAALETVARTHYSGQAVVHAAAGIVSLLTEGNQVRIAGDHLETQLGTLVHPIATTEVATMYLTGALTIYKGSNTVTDPLQNKNGSGNFNNLWQTFASTPVAVAIDCGLFYKVTGLP